MVTLWTSNPAPSVQIAVLAFIGLMAESGYVPDCRSGYTGSNPVQAFPLFVLLFQQRIDEVFNARCLWIECSKVLCTTQVNYVNVHILT